MSHDVDDPRIDELLDRWEDHDESGERLTVEDLCRECPELLQEVQRRVRLLSATKWMTAGDSESGFFIDGSDDHSTGSQSNSAASGKLLQRLPKGTLTTDEFTSSLCLNGILGEDDLAQLQQTGIISSDDTVEVLAETLIEQGRLTDWQARVILEQRSDPLLVDRYRILDVLGSGGMGVVFKARHTSMDRVVALKMLPPRLVDSVDKVARFAREMKAAARMSHPNVVTVFDASELAGSHFLAMEFVPGPNLTQYVTQNGTMSVAQAVRCVAQAAAGLQHAHENDVVHRDVKPANLLLAPDGVVKVADLGLAVLDRSPGLERIVSEFDEGLVRSDSEQVASSLTGGLILGTVSFISPEQATDSQQIDARADIYSLGATLHFLLTGQPPFLEKTAVKTLLAHREKPIPQLRKLRTDVPGILDNIFQRMLAKRPEDRFRSMQELIENLESVPVGSETELVLRVPVNTTADTHPVATHAEPTQAWQPEVSVTNRDLGRSRRLLVGLLAGAVTLVAVIAIIIRDREGKETRVDVEADNPVSVAINIEPDAPAIQTDSVEPVHIEPDQQTPEIISSEKTLKQAAELFMPFVAKVANTLGNAVEQQVPDDDSTHKTNAQARADLIAQGGTGVEQMPLTASEAKDYQAAWADRLDVPVKYENSIGMKLTLIPPGEFLMGYSDRNVEVLLSHHRGHLAVDLVPLMRRFAISRPQHPVLLTNAHYLGCHPVTRGQFQAFVEATGYTTTAESRLGTSPGLTWKSPGFEQADDHAVVQVSQADAVAFCSWLSKGEDIDYAIPTEALWEYACRAGTQSIWFHGNSPGGLSEYSTAPVSTQPFMLPVGTKKPNAFGVYDLYGNPSEFVASESTEFTRHRQIDPNPPQLKNKRTTRGYPKLGSAWRSNGSDEPESRYTFRVAYVLPTPLARPADSGNGQELPSTVANTESSSTALRPHPDAAPGEPYTNAVGMKFAWVKRGSFPMRGGSKNAETKDTMVKKDFYIGVYEVTQGDWQEVMGHNPSYFASTGAGAEQVSEFTDDELKKFPVENVNWYDSLEFTRKLTEKLKPAAGWEYRMATEAEWECACRGGGGHDIDHYNHDFYFDVPLDSLSPQLANHSDSIGRTTSVDSYMPNSLGIHSMHGNVREWCLDLIYLSPRNASRPRRISRGGDWLQRPSKAGDRGYLASRDRHGAYGLRIVLGPEVEVPQQVVHETPAP